MKAQLAQRDRRHGINHHAIGGKHLRIAVAGVHIVGNQQVHQLRRRCQFTRELRIRGLGQERRATRQDLLVGAEVHPEVRHRDRAHGAARIHLRMRRRRHRHEQTQRHHRARHADRHVDREAPHGLHHGCSTGVKIRK